MNGLTTSVSNEKIEFSSNASTTYFSADDFTLYQGNCVEIIRTLDISPVQPGLLRIYLEENGIDLDGAYLDISIKRKKELEENPTCTYIDKIRGLEYLNDYPNGPNTDIA